MSNAPGDRIRLRRQMCERTSEAVTLPRPETVRAYREAKKRYLKLMAPETFRRVLPEAEAALDEMRLAAITLANEVCQ